MFNLRLHRGVAVVLLAVLGLSACDTAQQAQQPVPQAQQNGQSNQQNGQQSSTSQANNAPGGPTSPIAGLNDQQIGSGGVVQAQAQPTPVFSGDQSLVSEYERTVNNVYRRNIGALVNLSDGRVTGSGFVIDAQGHIITNNHVAGEMQDITITFSDRSYAKGTLIGTFEDGDIAVVQADRLPQGTQPAQLGDSGNVQVGEITVAMGSPLGLEQTVTSGIVSALNRSIADINRGESQETQQTSLTGLIQTDASINPGNSGGPLFNSRGQVIGMNTLIATRSSSSETAGSIGLGFAVPINRIKRVANQILRSGKYQRPRLGVVVELITPQIARVLQLPVTSGVMIRQVSGQQAQQAGLQGATKTARLSINTAQGADQIDYPTDGDIIIAINNVPVRTTGDLRNVIETQADPGDTVTVTFLRGGREQTTRLTLQ